MSATLTPGANAPGTPTTLERIKSVCTLEPYPIQKIAAGLNIPYQTVYHAIKRGVDKGHFTIKKIDGIAWARAYTRPKGLDLIKGMQISNKFASNPINDMPRRCCGERHTAIRQSQRTKDIRNINERCEKEFSDYINRINNTEIVLEPNHDRNFFGDRLFLPYATRFNDMGRKVEVLKKYEHCWDNATEKHDWGVMVTLTTDPKQQHHLWEANKKVSENFNRFMSFLTRRKGIRPEYINIYEYQKNGRIHLHVMIFGQKWIMGKQELSNLWAKYGQGKIVDFLSIHKNSNNEWQWTRQKPKDGGGTTPPDYLKKYLKKGLWDANKLYQYWIYNNRFFTYSRVLCTVIKYSVSKGYYIFVGLNYDKFEDIQINPFEEMLSDFI